MKKTYKFIAVLLVFAMAAGILVACNSTDDGKDNSTATAAPEGKSGLPVRARDYIFTENLKMMLIVKSSGFVAFPLYVKAMEDQRLRYPNITIDYKDSEFDVNRQITLIEEAVTQGYAAIFLEAMDPVALNNAVRAAEDAGVPVITCNGPEPTEPHTAHISGADYSSGYTSGQMADEATRGMPNRTAIILDCPAAQKPGVRMGTGFEDYIKTTDIKLIEPPIGIENWSPENAQISMRDMLTKYPNPGDITMVYTSSDDMAVGAMQAIDAAGRNEILIFSNIGYPQGLEGVRDGKMYSTMFSDTYVEFSLMFYAALHSISTGLTSVTGGFTETPFLDMPLLPATKDNVDDIMAVSRWYSK